jgi:hypothetical protein
MGYAGVQVEGLDGRVAGNEGRGEGGATAHRTAVRGATLRRKDGNEALKNTLMKKSNKNSSHLFDRWISNHLLGTESW